MHSHIAQNQYTARVQVFKCIPSLLPAFVYQQIQRYQSLAHCNWKKGRNETTLKQRNINLFKEGREKIALQAKQR